MATRCARSPTQATSKAIATARAANRHFTAVGDRPEPRPGRERPASTPVPSTTSGDCIPCKPDLSSTGDGGATLASSRKTAGSLALAHGTVSSSESSQLCAGTRSIPGVAVDVADPIHVQDWCASSSDHQKCDGTCLTHRNLPRRCHTPSGCGGFVLWAV